jgi:hypothetical protein
MEKKSTVICAGSTPAEGNGGWNAEARFCHRLDCPQPPDLSRQQKGALCLFFFLLDFYNPIEQF